MSADGTEVELRGENFGFKRFKGFLFNQGKSDIIDRYLFKGLSTFTYYFSVILFLYPNII